ncbi:uncharacterized protein SPSK_06775 [Sporothrix schenckii 1099-18]|uniref:Uncharacterized protein n=1 Tax=Sporothrix schenckii 1099-18 TaxID=1397361 RepID=A0A0F2MIY8_SPOSC|nr:uncharacterized protein SPSK_06775 [Sporothrix schenckii 1099-18]KJR89582.1 hypothetical protein SPSK_06775 [Sporothrix schenckii 1099-18]
MALVLTEAAAPTGALWRLLERRQLSQGQHKFATNPLKIRLQGGAVGELSVHNALLRKYFFVVFVLSGPFGSRWVRSTLLSASNHLRRPCSAFFVPLFA